MKLYGALPLGLLQAYRDAGFEVAHVPVVDHQTPPLSGSELKSVEQHFKELPKPVLIHCSAGVDRTGAAVRHLKALHSAKANTIRAVYYDVDIYGLMAISPYVNPSVRKSYSIALALEE